MSLNKTLIIIALIFAGTYLALNWSFTKTTYIEKYVKVEKINRITGRTTIYVCHIINKDNKGDGWDIGNPDFYCFSKGKF